MTNKTASTFELKVTNLAIIPNVLRVLNYCAINMLKILKSSSTHSVLTLWETFFRNSTTTSVALNLENSCLTLVKRDSISNATCWPSSVSAKSWVNRHSVGNVSWDRNRISFGSTFCFSAPAWIRSGIKSCSTTFAKPMLLRLRKYCVSFSTFVIKSFSPPGINQMKLLKLIRLHCVK